MADLSGLGAIRLNERYTERIQMSPIPMKDPQQRARDNEKSHVLFATGDPAAPEQIKDSRSEVVLGLCTRCGAAEAELGQSSCIERMMKLAAERFEKLTPLQKAIEFARQRRSWVVGEMQLKDDDTVDPVMTREKAMALYAQMPEGALLAELERRMELDAKTDPLAPERRQGDRRKAHYGDGIQPWDHILAAGWGPAFAASNVLKYLRRTKNPEHSLESAKWYYEQLVAGAAGALTASPVAEWSVALGRLEMLLLKEELKTLRG
jgi:hypothetical protein